MAEENLGSMEGRLFWHDRLTYVNATSILRNINKYLDGDASDDKKGMAMEAGDIVISMMNSLASDESDDYLDLLVAGKSFMLKTMNAGMVQTDAKETKPDLALAELGSSVGLMGTRLAEAKFDLFNEKDGKPVLPADFIKFVSLDDIYTGCKQGAKEQNRRFDSTAVVKGWQDQINKLVMEPGKIRDMIAGTRFSTQRYFENEFAQVAADALDHMKHGYAKAGDDKRGLYKRGIGVLKEIKDVFFSNDPIYSSKQLFDAETYRFIDRVASSEQKKEIELSMGMPFGDLMNELGPSEKDRELELDSIHDKLMAYGRALEEANSLVYDMMKHEMVGGESDAKPDMYFLYSVEHVKNVVMGIDKIAPGINNSVAALSNVLGLKMMEATQKFEGQAPTYTEVRDWLYKCTEAKGYAVKKLNESVALYDTCWGATQYYGKEVDGVMVLEKRLDAKVFDDMMEIARKGGSDVARNMENYVKSGRVA